jgi:glutamine synthetase
LYVISVTVVTEEVIETWINYKMDKEINPMALQPHRFEFGLYYDV